MYHNRNNYLKYVLLLLVMVMIFIFIDRNNRAEQLYESLDIEFFTKTVEYGSNTKAKDLVRSHIGDLSIGQQIDTYKVGTQTITYTLSKTEERYKQLIKRNYETDIEVKDTKAPVLELKEDEVYVYVNSDYDPKDNIADAYDIIDGKIEEVSIIGDCDLSRSGSYELIASVSDKNGLKTEKPFILKVRNRAVSGSEGYNIIYNYLTGTYGYNKAAACGILANIRYESNFNPDIGDYYYGLCQWGGSRQTNLFNYCANNGLDASSIEGQLEYLNYEMTSSYPGVKNYLLSVENSASGAYSAAEYFCRNFEGAASSEGRGDLASSYFGS